MFGTDSNHYQVVSKSLSGQETVSEQTFLSIAILQDRLERLKSTSALFDNVELSADVFDLIECHDNIAIS